MRTRAIAVPDMTGDGKAEIVFVQPDLMTISWATSESNYATVNSRQIGDQRSVFF